MRLRTCFLFCLAAALAWTGYAQPSGGGQQSSASGGQSSASSGSGSRVESVYTSAQKQGTQALYNFLIAFPKGADLHSHLSGAVYAETFIRDASKDGLCVDPSLLKFAPPPCKSPLIPATELTGNITAADQSLYDKLIDSFSMRSFVPTTGWSGHDQFFATFDHFSGLSGSHLAEWIDEVARRAAAQNNQYLELMETPVFTNAQQIAKSVGWPAALSQPDVSPMDFAQLRQQMMDKGLVSEVPADREEVQTADAARRAMEGCGTAKTTPACQVEVRYIYRVLRGRAPEQVFAQTLLGFETVEASMRAKEDTWVGINFVQPEDGVISMRDYTLQMKMVGYLHTVYPDVPISLHAGELTLGLVPPDGLRFHIRQAVEIAHAQRIGHGVDLMEEDDAEGLLKELAQNHILIEINLTSNEDILGVKGTDHPFPIYRGAKVPVALSTDDEGVNRIDLTHEYTRAAIDYTLTYANLKGMARESMEHSFLPGASLWAYTDHFEAAVKACQADTLGADTPSAGCKAVLDASEKATAEWELERRFGAFEAQFSSSGHGGKGKSGGSAGAGASNSAK